MREAVSDRRAGDRRLALWLLICCAMIAAMVAIGGITRLTESGLSITEWRPIGGALPPLSAAEWERLFALYQQTPEYRQINLGMSLAEFKGIFWWEYFHRLWGRLIGIVFLLPFLWFLLRGQIRRRLIAPLAGLFLLGGAQGALGWFMVASGLSERTDVSQYRLVAHLALALIIYGATLWLALGLWWGEQPARLAARWRPWLWAGLGLIGLTILFGGFTAGLNGGLVYNSYPTMNGDWLPAELFGATPAWLAPFEIPAAAQFLHRWLATGTLLYFLWLWARGRDGASHAWHGLAIMAALQFALGLATLLLAVPIGLAAAHQLGAVALLTVALVALRQSAAIAPGR